jgi:hypothetical protein
MITGQRNIKIHHKIFHQTVCGTISQYPTVVIVTTPHQRVAGTEENSLSGLK